MSHRPGGLPNPIRGSLGTPECPVLFSQVNSNHVVMSEFVFWSVFGPGAYHNA